MQDSLYSWNNTLSHNVLFVKCIAVIKCTKGSFLYEIYFVDERRSLRWVCVLRGTVSRDTRRGVVFIITFTLQLEVQHL